MSLPTPVRDLVGPYSDALSAYLTEGHQSALTRARDLGDTALLNGLGVAEICGIHHESLQRFAFALTNGNPPAVDGPTGAIPAAGVFLAAVLAGLEPRNRELHRTNAALRNRAEKLEVAQRQVSNFVYGEALQLVAALRMAMANSCSPPPGVIWEIVNRLEDQLAVCAEGLQPRVIEDLGLACAIRSLSRRFAAASRLDVTTEASVGPLSPEVSLTLYRAVLEALTNIHRHARARRVSIHLCEDCSVIHCSIRDDGVGFELSKVLSDAELQGSGFVAMRESLRTIGGTLAVDSMPGSGTELRISVCPRLTD